MRFHDSEDYRSSDRMQLLHNGPSLSREEGRLIRVLIMKTGERA